MDQQHEALPDDEQFSWVLNLICLLAVRNPQLRASMNRARRYEARVIMDLLASDRNLFNTDVEAAQQDGFIDDSAVSFEAVQEFVRRGNYSIEIPTQESLATELSAFNKILPFITHRYWSLLLSERVPFLACDHPVTLDFKDPKRHGPIGYALRNTELVFPLNARQALYGVFEDPQPPVGTFDVASIAVIKSRVFESAERQIYSREPHCVVLLNGVPNEVLLGPGE